MPINQIRKVNPAETSPAPKSETIVPERDTSVSVEKSPAESVGEGAPGLYDPVTPSITPIEPEQIVKKSPLASDERFGKIENILESDLGDIYFNLSQADKQSFKAKGEETAIKILNLLSKPKVKMKKVVFLIKDWLRTVPGINKFFLEQTAKIKADKIIEQTSNQYQ